MKTSRFIIYIIDRCVVQLEERQYIPPCTKLVGRIHPGAWAINLVESDYPKLFVGSVRSARERQLAMVGGVDVDTEHGAVRVRLVESDPLQYTAFREGFANRTLWLLHHGLMEANSIPVDEIWAYFRSFAVVNENVASAVWAEILQRHGRVTVFWQDYQWYVAPALLRKKISNQNRGDIVLQHFVHVAFPGPEAWLVLPAAIRREIFEGLASNDVVGFHTARFAANFINCCETFLGYRVDRRDGIVTSFDGHKTLVRAYPLPTSPMRFKQLAQKPDARQFAQQLRKAVGEHRILIFRTERLDPAKAFPDALRAFRALISQEKFRGRVVYVAQLVPSRGNIPEWATLRAEITRQVEEINRTFATLDWTPVLLSIEENIEKAIGGYLEYDVLDVVPRSDGMNLVSLEGPCINERQGVLVLSSGAGSHDLLSHYALTVPPGDLDVHCKVLANAVDMPHEERRYRSQGLRKIVHGRDPRHWVEAQIRDGEAFVLDRFTAS